METNELLEPFERMLAKLFPPSRVREIDSSAEWQDELAEVEASGFLDILAPEANGGAGLPFSAAIALFAALGRHAAPLGIGRAMLERAGYGEAHSANSELVMLSAMMAGAGDRLLAMTTAYANERVQFGKPIGRQQAVQQNLAVMAEHCVAVRLTVELAGDGSGPPDGLRAALAKSVASTAVPLIANIAHSVHGAIGISAEYDLQLFTRRLHAWRAEQGSESRHHRSLGKSLLAGDAKSVDWLRAEIFDEIA
ncbi:acyl-CoA dehydrogenase family protein [Parerythrobacter lacustris]|uniref:Acyl-CoA/acyl-ACP dehydrogenase n=1 Tax=Parerythrobacter lacustris TaxID=2969984 RepID=A0ABT1XU58_9SPHN|nr:acyl-CoA dehydrogenase family protein [Parerythrobacter lacustris]MCR2835178.1 acyl-CoA/acyl-ACP dehydrogenase [Parerythrobacter lacustris]